MSENHKNSFKKSTEALIIAKKNNLFLLFK